MIKSMTGYGRAREVRNKRDITVEVRSVNNRYLDCTVKMPRMYSFAEDAVKQCVQKAISRGKVDVFITVDASAADVAKELAAQYAAALAELSEVCGTESKVTPEQLSRFPDVLTVTKEDEDLETVSADLCAVAEQALEAYNAMRAVEGRKLAEDIGNRLTYIENYTSQVEQRSPETVTEYRAKLTARMEEVLQSTTIDPQRILQEAAIYADKVAVDEETVRLRSHIAQYRSILELDEPVGRLVGVLPWNGVEQQQLQQLVVLHPLRAQRQIPAFAALAMPVVQAHDDPSPPAAKTVNSRQYSIPHISMCHKLFFRTFVAVQDRLTLWRRRGIVPVLSAATG